MSNTVINEQDGQSGDRHYGQVGQNITNQGASFDSVFAFISEYTFKADQTRETAIKEVKDELKRLGNDIGIISDALRTVRDRVDDIVNDREEEKAERRRRQGEVDQRDTVKTVWLIILSIALLLLIGRLWGMV